MPKKLPALHFYPGDWWRDDGVMALNCEERGAWAQILFIMHDAPRRGYLEVNGSSYPKVSLARKLGMDVCRLEKILQKIQDYNVASIEETTGILYSRRMVLDEEKRQVYENNGKMGGRPKNQTNNLNVTKPITKTITKTKPKPNQTPEDENEYENEIKELKDNELINQDLAFAIAWKAYPVPNGKKAAFRHFKATVKTKKDWLRQIKAFNFYGDYVIAQNRNGGKRRWQDGSTFFNNWEEWAEKAEKAEKEER